MFLFRGSSSGLPIYGAAMLSTPEQKYHPGGKPQGSISTNFVQEFRCTLVTGFVTAAVFNPWDKALYLSVKEGRPFLAPINWHLPFRGFLRAFVARTLSTGLYFPLGLLAFGVYACVAEATFYSRLLRSSVFGATSRQEGLRAPQSLTESASRHEGGLGEETRLEAENAAAIALEKGISRYPVHSFYAQGGKSEGVRTETVREGRARFGSSVLTGRGGRQIWRRFTLRTCSEYALSAATLYRGFVATVARDSLFGGVYACARHHLMMRRPEAASRATKFASSEGNLHRRECRLGGGEEGSTLFHRLMLNTVAACVAVAASSPLNYVKNMQLAASPESPQPRMRVLLGELVRQVAAAPGAQARLAVLSRSLLLGWGTLRAAVGMAFGAFVFDLCREETTIHT
ncbi:mitochondrial carrier protein [Cyclospora cayetanensis]|uniref:Mitochondrial carrier protein n=1 Tax=Cyclospora cayetanensis TaxID=88456 RepID=A0A1D3CUB7_9EIME|nr:mitochondrial carrier protein [Cyclospora cayetanensis]